MKACETVRWWRNANGTGQEGRRESAPPVLLADARGSVSMTSPRRLSVVMSRTSWCSLQLGSQGDLCWIIPVGSAGWPYAATPRDFCNAAQWPKMPRVVGGPLGGWVGRNAVGRLPLVRPWCALATEEYSHGQGFGRFNGMHPTHATSAPKCTQRDARPARRIISAI